jgi:ATP-dependent helicase HrpA
MLFFSMESATLSATQRVNLSYWTALSDFPPGRRNDPDVTEVRWMLEELRVSLFAQTLGTLVPVSETRILAGLSRLRP